MESCIREIEILVFSAMGIRLGVETAQVNGIMEVEQAASRGVAVFNIPDQLKISFGTVVYKSPKVLLVNIDSLVFGITVDRVEEIKAVGLDRIQPLPVLIEKCSGTKAIWGSVVDGDEVILLVDFHRLPCCNPTAETGADISV